jgi:hypothetical protein
LGHKTTSCNPTTASVVIQQIIGRKGRVADILQDPVGHCCREPV